MVLPRIVKAVVFDMDGLLVDSERTYREASMATARDMGLEFPDHVYHRTIGQSWAGIVPILHEHFGAGFDTDLFRERSTAKFYETAEAEVCLKAGVLEVLDHLDERGLPRAIATSSGHHNVRRHMTAHGILERFHTVVAQGDYARGKPSPDPFITAAERLDVAPQDCLALEDSHNGVRAAAAAGMMTIMVPDLLDATEEMQALCIRIARDLHEVRELLAGQGHL